MVSQLHNNRRRYNIGKLNFFVWNEKMYICSNTYFTAFLKLHWPYFCQPAELNCRFWCLPTLDQNCHHQLIFCKLTLKIEYPPPYACEVWSNGKTQTDLINRIIDHFDRVNLFLDKNINEQVILFHRTILNIFHNFIPNEIILCDGRNPPSMNERIKQLIKMKNVILKNKKSQAQSTMSSKAISH